MGKIEYAITDIETTGGNASGSRITEIAIIIHDGIQIIDRYETLINPGQNIPFYISGLTGIDNDMVRDAPMFSEVAEKILELLANRVFVAHNVNFDYSFIRHQLKEAGFDWTAQKLCTVRVARKIKPGFKSYSLGNLCRSLGISIANRHRAGGDADATAILFSQLLDCDSNGDIAKMLKKTSPEQRLPPNLPPRDFEKLPEKPGVYYFHNQERKVVYVGKAINIKKRVASHFTGNSITPQRQHFLRDIYSISYEVCANELMALLLECIEIKKLWPEHNRALKRFEPKFGLYQYEGRNGYKYLAVGKLAKFQACMQCFNSEYEAATLLRNLMEKFDIDYRFCKYGRPAENEFTPQKNVNPLPDCESHNLKIENALESLLQNRPSYAIIDTGRNANEKSCIWVENGEFYGMGYINTDVSLTDISAVKDYIDRQRSSQYIMQLIQSFAEKFPSKVIFAKSTVSELVD